MTDTFWNVLIKAGFKFFFEKSSEKLKCKLFFVGADNGFNFNDNKYI